MRLLIPRSAAAWAQQRAATIVGQRQRQRSEALSLYRSLLRVAQRHEAELDPVCGEYIAWRTRDRFGRARHKPSMAKRSGLAAARSGLRRARGALDGNANDAQRLIDLAYGRVGRVRHVMQAHITRARSGGAVYEREVVRGPTRSLPPTIGRELSTALGELRAEKAAEEAAHAAERRKVAAAATAAAKRQDAKGAAAALPKGKGKGKGKGDGKREAKAGQVTQGGSERGGGALGHISVNAAVGAGKHVSLPFPAKTILELRGRLRWRSRRTRRFYQKFVGFRSLAMQELAKGNPEAIAAAEVAVARLAKGSERMRRLRKRGGKKKK
jgi:hypothetical protein